MKIKSKNGFIICRPIHFSIFPIGRFDLHFLIIILSHVCLFIRKWLHSLGLIFIVWLTAVNYWKELKVSSGMCQQTYSGSFKETVLCHTHTTSARSKWGSWKFASCQALSCLLAARDCLSPFFRNAHTHTVRHTQRPWNTLFTWICVAVTVKPNPI